MRAKTIKLYVGLNDKDTKEQEISTEQALKKVDAILWELTDGATVTQAQGVYKSEDGHKIIENSIIIELMNIAENVIKEIIEILKRMFNQESVMLTETVSDCSFI